MVSQSAQIFVGRQREVAELRSALEDALAGRGRLTMLVGEPGIGKTRTAEELASYAETRGAQVHWGWCYEGEGAPPYWPWLQIIRSYVQQVDSRRLRSEMGPGAADIAEISLETRQKLPGLAIPPPLAPEQARFRLFDSITSFLNNASKHQPLVIVLDDLHWADRSSLLLLEFMIRQISGSRLFFLGTYRDVEVSRNQPLSQTLGGIVREPLFHSMHLDGLNQEEVGSFVEAASGLTPDPSLVESVHSRTEGNPLFLRQIVRLLEDEGFQANLVRQVGIPGGIQDAIGRRLNHLSEGCNRVLTTASIIGREFGLSLLDRLMDDVSEEQLLEAMDEALAAGVIRDTPGSAELYQFTHALIQETLASKLSSSRRVRLHARIGEALEDLYGPDTDAHAAELVHHFSQSAAAHRPGKVVYYSLLAGHQALAAYAYEEALSVFERGLGAKDEQPMDNQAAELLFGLGRAQEALAMNNEATASLSRAFDYYAETAQISHAVAIAEDPHLSQYIGQGIASDLMRRALDLVPPNSRESARLLSRYGRVLGVQEGKYEEAAEVLGQALAIARRENDPETAMRTLTAAASVDVFDLQWQQGLEKCQQAIELASHVDDPYSESTAHAWAARALYVMGRLDEGKSHANANLSLAERLRDRYWLGTALWLNEVGAHLSANWMTARAFSDRCLALLPDDTRILSTRALLEYQTGNAALGSKYVGLLIDALGRLMPGQSAQFLYSAIATPVVISLITGSFDHFDEMAAIARSLQASSNIPPFVSQWSRAALALTAVQQGDISAAKEQYDALKSRRGTMLVGGTIGISADRLLGLLSWTSGRPDEAAEHFDDALIFCRGAGYNPEYAWSAYEYARLLFQRSAKDSRRSRSGDQDRTMPLLSEALAMASELQMTPLVGLVNELRQRAESQTPNSPTRLDGLTQRELDVLRLVAGGKTNSEIGDELVISTNTVLHHVTNILSKTGAANRAEAAAYAVRHQILAE